MIRAVIFVNENPFQGFVHQPCLKRICVQNFGIVNSKKKKLFCDTSYAYNVTFPLPVGVREAFRRVPRNERQGDPNLSQVDLKCLGLPRRSISCQEFIPFNSRTLPNSAIRTKSSGVQEPV